MQITPPIFKSRWGFSLIDSDKTYCILKLRNLSTDTFFRYILNGQTMLFSISNGVGSTTVIVRTVSDTKCRTCRFVNDVLQKRKRRNEGIQDPFGGLPVERSHGEMIVSALADSELFFEIFKGLATFLPLRCVCEENGTSQR